MTRPLSTAQQAGQASPSGASVQLKSRPRCTPDSLPLHRSSEPPTASSAPGTPWGPTGAAAAPPGLSRPSEAPDPSPTHQETIFCFLSHRCQGLTQAGASLGGWEAGA